MGEEVLERGKQSKEGCCTWRPRRRAASSTIPPLAQFTIRTPSLHMAIVSSPVHTCACACGRYSRQKSEEMNRELGRGVNT